MHLVGFCTVLVITMYSREVKITTPKKSLAASLFKPSYLWYFLTNSMSALSTSFGCEALRKC